MFILSNALFMSSRSKKKLKNDSGKLSLTPALRNEFVRFIEFHSARRLSRNLRTMLLEFLMYDGTTDAVYLKDLVHDLEGLFRLLEAIESEAGPKAN